MATLRGLYMYSSKSSHEDFTELTRIVSAQIHDRDVKAKAWRHASCRLLGIAPTTSAAHVLITKSHPGYGHCTVCHCTFEHPNHGRNRRH